MRDNHVALVEWDEDRHEVLARCDCYSETLSVSVDFRDAEEDNLPLLYLSIQDRACLAGASWRARLRHIWRIIRHGEPYGDQFIFHVDNAEKFADLLLKKARELKLRLAQAKENR